VVCQPRHIKSSFSLNVQLNNSCDITSAKWQI